MAFVNANGENISYECSDLIEELKEDIVEFSGDMKVIAWCREYEGVIVYTNYDFIDNERPIQESELDNGEFLREMTMGELLIVLEKQNEIVDL